MYFGLEIGHFYFFEQEQCGNMSEVVLKSILATWAVNLKPLWELLQLS